jgi:hypothetical protein
MRKVSVYFACFFILIVIGCGNTSGDPTARITTLKAEPAEVTPGGNSVITVTVTKATGTTTTTTTATGTGTATTTGTTTTTTTTAGGWGENVTFTLLTANGAHLSAVTQKTDGDGKATTVYTAGNNYNQDVIQITLDNGMAASVVITKKGNVSGASIKITTEPTSASVNAFGYISIIAKVTDSSGDTAKPVSGETVEFKLVENNSGATLTIRSTVTDAVGQAIATYRAGGNEPAQDVVQAKLMSNGSTSSVIIDVTAGGTGPVISAITASSTSVKPGQQSIVKVNVTDGDKTNPLPVGGELVTIRIIPNNSGSSLIIQNNYTDAQGQVVATYIAGNPSVEVEDTVQAQVVSSGSVNSVIITVTPPTAL